MESYENFPLRIVLLSTIVALSIYVLGAYILLGLGAIFSALYLAYCLLIEGRVLRMSCVHCYYYDKLCGLGKGKICALLFRKGDPAKFLKTEITWKDLLPDFMVLIFPLVGGAIILFREFSFLLAAVMVLFAVLYLGGNAIVRGSFACKYCKQRELGCPAEKLFSKK